MYRFALDYLKQWKGKKARKPLVIRGARQVGKSYLVRLFASECFENIVEVNCERDSDAASLLPTGDPVQACRLLEARFNMNIIPGKTLLFLDEIQASPSLFAGLRYFYETMPELHVIAAGSLLKFVLEQHLFSMPVGRIEYLHLGPMVFDEFLIAAGREKLHSYLTTCSIEQGIPEALHRDLSGLLKQYLVVGGMPEAVKVYTETGSLRECDAIKQSILSTYRDDFGKYGRRVNHERLQKVFDRIPSLAGRKFKYANVDREKRSKELGQALRMLCQARIAYPAYHTDANGVPLGAEINRRDFKVIFLDVGLMVRALGLSLLEFEKAEDIMLVNSGSVCEQFIGQHLLAAREFFDEPEVYCWMRQKKSSNAEVDYIFPEGPRVIPVEVKAGKSGTLKSLHLFLREKKGSLGIRFNSDVPSLMTDRTNLPDGQNVQYRLLSLPLYMAGNLRRILKEII